MSRRLRRALLLAWALPGLLTASVPARAEDVHICLLAPHGDPGVGGRVRALVPLERPTIFAAEPLAELRLEEDGRVLWRREPPLLEPLQGPQAWPLRPLRAGERMLLRLRPAGEPRGRFATIELETAPAAVLERNRTLLTSLGSDGRRWQQAVEGAMDRRDGPLVAALLFAFEGPSFPSLDDLRRTAYERGCGATGSGGLQDAPTPSR